MLKLTWQRAAAWRTERHHLIRRASAGSMLAVVSRLCGLHAQLMSSAELSLWARVEDLKRENVRRALWEDRTLIKTWAMRGTLHLLPASELSLWHGALTTSRRYLSPTRWQKHFGLTMKELDTLTSAIGRALDGSVMTRGQLAKEVGRITGSRKLAAKLAEGSWGTILKPAAFAGHLCFGPSQGQLVCFTRPGSWLKEQIAALDPDTATAMVTRRFLAAYGPATYHDLARWWGGGGVSTARQWIVALGEEVSPIDVDGTHAWMLARDLREMRDFHEKQSVRLLPAFDQYVVAASHHAEHLLPGKLRSRVYRPQGWISPVLLVNGRMEGVWRHVLKGSRIEVVIEPFVKIPPSARRAAEQEAERLAHFVGGALQFKWGR